ncbi:MAG: hypothetical protein DMF06_03425 [Verrucomicrobia bacterium]|nr:MAG: hypothetical protein DMF06_03425 [Verrucomicrobiota bacterium]
MRSKTVVLGGKEYRIDQLAMRPNREWREKLGQPVTELASLLGGFQSLQVDSAGDIAKIVTVVKDLLLGSMDLLLDALFKYSPALEADRERIEREAYDDEALAALGVAVSLAYPLDMALLVLRPGGLPGTAISTNSPLANGANGTPLPSVPRRRTTKT